MNSTWSTARSMMSPRRCRQRARSAEVSWHSKTEYWSRSPSTQVKLLRVLQEREIERLGGTSMIRINVRLITATLRPLEQLMEDGRFRADLFYRLAVFTIFAPPLRERKPDIMLLADHFLDKYAREHGKGLRRISTPAIDMLTSYHWPGNVRELENTMERAGSCATAA